MTDAVDWVIVLVALGIAGIIASLVVTLSRYRRRKMPVDALHAAWRSIDRALARNGLARPPWRTPMSHLQDLRTGQEDDGALATLGDMELVASLLEVATFGQAVASLSDSEDAVRASRRARTAIRSGSLVRREAGTRSGPVADATGPSPTSVIH